MLNFLFKSTIKHDLFLILQHHFILTGKIPDSENLPDIVYVLYAS